MYNLFVGEVQLNSVKQICQSTLSLLGEERVTGPAKSFSAITNVHATRKKATSDHK